MPAKKTTEKAPSKLFVRKGDRVRVMRGNERGKEGTILRVDREKNRVVVEGINLRKRHMRPSATNAEGGIITFEAAISASNRSTMSLSRRARMAWVSGSPKRALNSRTWGPEAVSITPA